MIVSTEIVDVVNNIFNVGQHPPKSVEAAFCHGGGPRKDCEVEFRPTWMPSLKYHYIPIKLKVALLVGRNRTMGFRGPLIIIRQRRQMQRAINILGCYCPFWSSLRLIQKGTGIAVITVIDINSCSFERNTPQKVIWNLGFKEPII